MLLNRGFREKAICFDSLVGDEASQANSILYSGNATILSLKSLQRILANVDARVFAQELKEIYYKGGLLQRLVKMRRGTKKQFSRGYSIVIDSVLDELEELLQRTRNVE